MVDRESRNTLLSTIDDYLAGRIRTSEFDQRLWDFKADDRTAREIVFQSWFFYDDFIDHPVGLTRSQWNCFQRFRLILQSNAEIRTNRVWNCSLRHLWMAGTLAALAVLVWTCGLDWPFFAAYFTLGIINSLILHFGHNPQPPASPIPITETQPFASLSSLCEVYESVPEFKKMPYRHDMDFTRLRRKFTIRPAWLPKLIAWPLLACLFLSSISKSKQSVILPHPGH